MLSDAISISEGGSKDILAGALVGHHGGWGLGGLGEGGLGAWVGRCVGWGTGLGAGVGDGCGLGRGFGGFGDGEGGAPRHWLGGRCVMASQTVSVPVRQLPLSSHEPGRIALSRLYRSAGIVDERAFPASTSVVMEESCDS